jgi:hypothetical protein
MLYTTSCYQRKGVWKRLDTQGLVMIRIKEILINGVIYSVLCLRLRVAAVYIERIVGVLGCMNACGLLSVTWTLYPTVRVRRMRVQYGLSST